MIHLLTPHPSAVDYGAKTVCRPGLAGELPRHGQHFAECALMLHPGIVERFDMSFGDDEEVNRRYRPDIVESEDISVFVKFFRRDAALDYFAE